MLDAWLPPFTFTDVENVSNPGDVNMIEMRLVGNAFDSWKQRYQVADPVEEPERMLPDCSKIPMIPSQLGNGPHPAV